jgi:hypothetical protein
MPAQVTCPSCNQPLDAEAFVNACLRWNANADYVQIQCPACARTAEARLETGLLTFGYTYAAGTVHFAGMEPVPLSTLVVGRAPEGLEITLDAVTRTLPRS